MTANQLRDETSAIDLTDHADRRETCERLDLLIRWLSQCVKQLREGESAKNWTYKQYLESYGNSLRSISKQIIKE